MKLGNFPEQGFAFISISETALFNGAVSIVELIVLVCQSIELCGKIVLFGKCSCPFNGLIIIRNC